MQNFYLIKNPFLKIVQVTCDDSFCCESVKFTSLMGISETYPEVEGKYTRFETDIDGNFKRFVSWFTIHIWQYLIITKVSK